MEARNPTKQHSYTLESYLIKPVQRVLKYPLLLRELVSLTDTDSEEHYHLTGTQVHLGLTVANGREFPVSFSVLFDYITRVFILQRL